MEVDKISRKLLNHFGQAMFEDKRAELVMEALLDISCDILLEASVSPTVYDACEEVVDGNRKRFNRDDPEDFIDDEY